ncbi:MAG TPA: phenylalanine--tRNA ligase subunit beta [Candidatus Polarisedimenticolaceae bacterium]|nr:phenylalanine--tRNA ligase subunit beta [Candidatus Polarisedimenticolaceae bacterium]
MLISHAWLEEISGIDADAREVARRLTARGLTVDAIAEAGDDRVLDVDVPANRPDALGHRGVAREVAAAFGRSPLPKPAVREPGLRGIEVAIEAPDLCRRYTASIVRGVRVAPSPPWVVARLEACGLRSINNVVDASNLVMLELGQPVHFFDLARLTGGVLRVRPAFAAEALVTLDGVSRTLDAGTIVIADGARGVALGGIMGGDETQITAETRDVLIEAAWFQPAAVRRAARKLGLVTDASQRFERGADPEAPPAAQALAVRLLETIAGGRGEPGIVDAYPAPFPARSLAVRLPRVALLLGYAPGSAESEEALRALDLRPTPTAEGFEVEVPSWRVDLTREADLVEEIGRHLGYDRIPSHVPATPPPASGLRTFTSLNERARDRLAALGFSEAFNYAMIAAGDDDAFVAPGLPPSMPLSNPIAETLGVLRRALTPGLVQAAALNVRRGLADVRLFEAGHVFLARGAAELPDEPLRLAFAWHGAGRPRHWSEPSREVEAYDAIGLVEDLLALASDTGRFTQMASDLRGLHPGRRTAWIDADGRTAAWCGALHPDLAARLDVQGPLYVGEIDLGVASAHAAARPAYRAIARVPSITRDLSIVLSPGAPAGSVLTVLAAVPAPAPAEILWIDRYEGPPLDAGEAAMTLRVILQPLERTLTDDEAEAFRSRLVAALATVPGARLRRIDT